MVGSAPGFGPENIGPVIGPLYDRLIPALEAAGVPLRDPSTIYYTGEGADTEIGERIGGGPCRVPGRTRRSRG